nr:4'-phosphopantetheinyl transferase superfamily protein [Duganella qianjiadongensis]
MATLLHHPPASIHIDNRRGHAPQISIAGSHGPAPQCSFAYADRYALAALKLHGAIGVDLMPVIDIPDWQAVARDYLGPQVCARLQALPASQRAAALAQEWCRLEAQLKCRGVALAEWREECRADARHAPLILPQAAMAGHVAWR